MTITIEILSMLIVTLSLFAMAMLCAAIANFAAAYEIARSRDYTDALFQTSFGLIAACAGAATIAIAKGAAA